MKYISILILVIFMGWTWSLANHSSLMSLQEHRDVEKSFEEYIRNSIQQKNPGVKEVIFRQLFTETIKDGEEVRAQFRYDIVSPTASNDTTNQTIEGSALLKSGDSGANWTLSDLELNTPSIRFQNGLHISGKGGEAPIVPPAKDEPASDGKK